MASKIIAEVDFNRDDDSQEFSANDRIIDIYCIGDAISLAFDLGRREDDMLTLTLGTDELVKRLNEAIRRPD